MNITKFCRSILNTHQKLTETVQNHFTINANSGLPIILVLPQIYKIKRILNILILRSLNTTLKGQISLEIKLINDNDLQNL